MAKKLAILTIHGMGQTRRNYWAGLEKELKNRLGSEAWKDIHFEPIYYQDLMQDNQSRVWREMPREVLDVESFRKFMLFYFSDAAALEHKTDSSMSIYVRAELKVREALDRALTALGEPTKPVVVIAQSLGCHMMSNYIWDSAKGKRVWKHHPVNDRDEAEIGFLKLQTLRFLITSGCNIPLFVSGLNEILAIDPPNPEFRWLNYFDSDDMLGWPLKTLSPSYDAVVEDDIVINVGSIFSSWNPLCHTKYWTDNDFLRPVARKLRALYRYDLQFEAGG